VVGIEDPRHRNILCDRSSIKSYLGEYADRLGAALRAIEPAVLERVRDVIERAAADGRRIHAIGNGGSAAIAEHLCCDFTKGTHVVGHPIVEARSMTSNVPLYTAIANDFGFETVFSKQIEYVAREGDVLLAISSSGNSPNILAGVAAAKAIGMITVGFSGFSGGRLRQEADISVHVDDSNYGIIEDAHQALMHVLAQFIAGARDHGHAA
jgi:D-sedoheptulose 7-phosphate isomerase